MSEPLIEVVTRDGLERRIGEIQDSVAIGQELKAQLQSAVANVLVIGTGTVTIGGVELIGGTVSTPQSGTIDGVSIRIGGLDLSGTVISVGL